LGEPTRLAIIDMLSLSDHTPRELNERLAIGSNLLAFHLDVLESAGLVSRRRSSGDRRRKYLRLELRSLGTLHAVLSLSVSRLLFVCRQNSARSQLAAAIWNSSSDIPATSAGSDPAERVHPEAVRVAAKNGLDIGNAQPRGYSDVEHLPDLVVSVCDVAHESDVPFQQASRIHWSVADPVAAGTTRAFEESYLMIEHRIKSLQTRVTESREPAQVDRK
jgi:protein-tyrosine-phosphatase